MNRAEFEADLVREGYEVRQGGIEPNVHRPSHTHDFDARVMVLEGAITLVFGEERCVSGRATPAAFRPAPYMRNIPNGRAFDTCRAVVRPPAHSARRGRRVSPNSAGLPPRSTVLYRGRSAAALIRLMPRRDVIDSGLCGAAGIVHKKNSQAVPPPC